MSNLYHDYVLLVLVTVDALAIVSRCIWSGEWMPRGVLDVVVLPFWDVYGYPHATGQDIGGSRARRY